MSVVVRLPNNLDAEIEESVSELAPHRVLDRQRDLAKTLIGLAVPVSLATGILGSSGFGARTDFLKWSVVLLSVGIVLGVIALRSISLPRATHDLAAVERKFGRVIRVNKIILVGCSLALAGSVAVASAAVALKPSKAKTPTLDLEQASGRSYILSASFEMSDSCRGFFPGAVIETRSSKDAEWLTIWSAGWTSGTSQREESLIVQPTVESVRLRICSRTVALLKVEG